MIINPIEQEKCAPSKDFTDGSCLTTKDCRKLQ